MSGINIKKLLRIAVIGATLFALLLLSGCFLSATDKKGSSGSSQAGNNDDYEGDPTYVTDVYDVEYDGSNFNYIFNAPIENTVKLLSYVTIDGVDYPMTENRIGAHELTEERINVSSYYLSEEIRNTTADKFSITAYTESIDGTKRGEAVTVEFLNYAIHPILDTETGVITWKNHPVYSGFEIVASFDFWNFADYEATITESRLDTSVFPEKYKDDPAKIYIEAIVNEDAEYTKVYYTPNGNRAFIQAVKHSLSDVKFMNNVISWYCNDNRFFTTEYDQTFDLVITDGEEVINKTLTFAYDEPLNYTYVPKTDKFSISVSGGVNDPRFIQTEPITQAPVCAGYLDNIRVVDRYVCWDTVKALNDEGAAFVADSLISYSVYQDGEMLGSFTEKRVRSLDMNALYGESEISVSAQVNAANYYFCSDESITVFYGKEPTLTCEKIDENSARILISDVDENATSYVLYSDSNFVTDFSLELDNTGGVISYVFTPKEEGKYYIYAYPVYENSNSIAVSNKSSVCVDRVKRVLFDKVKFENDRWYIKFECGQYETQTSISYSIIADKEEYSSEGTMKLNEWLKLPSCLTYSDSIKVTVKAKRYTRFTPTERSVELFGDGGVFPIEVLPAPTDMRTDGKDLLWSYDTDMPYTKFGVNVMYYDYTSYAYKTVYHTKSTEKSINLFDAEEITGNKIACVYAIADNSNYVEGGNIYLDSTHWEQIKFERLSAPKVYAEGTEKIIFCVNDADSSDKDLTESDEAIAVTVWGYDGTSGEKVSYTASLGHGSSLSVLSYFTEWGAEEIYIDVQVCNTNGHHINGPRKTFTVLTPKMTGFAISNYNGALSWDDYLTGTTYAYTLFARAANSGFAKVASAEGIKGCSIDIRTPLWSFASQNVDKTFDSLIIRIMPTIDPALQTPTEHNATLILAPKEAFEFEFSALSYILTRAENVNGLLISFNKEFEEIPTVTAKTTQGASLGTASANEAYFSFSSLVAGIHTVVFTCNVASGVLDELNTFNIPYYHSLTVTEKPTADGYFKNFRSGEYYLKPIGSMAGGYYIDSSRSTPATVDFYLISGSELYFDGSLVATTGGAYTLNLLTSNSIKVRVRASKGFSASTHSYTKADYDFYETFTYEAYMPTMLESCYVKNGILYVETSSYNQYVFITVLRNGVAIAENLSLTKGLNSGELTYNPTKTASDEELFKAGEVVTVILTLDRPGYISEACYIREITVD